MRNEEKKMKTHFKKLSNLRFLMLFREAYYMYYKHCNTKASSNNVPTMSYVFSYFN
jgi:hypothetical protein